MRYEEYLLLRQVQELCVTPHLQELLQRGLQLCHLASVTLRNVGSLCVFAALMLRVLAFVILTVVVVVNVH